MNDFERTNVNQGEDGQSEAERVLGPMPSFEGHMKEISSTDLDKVVNPINGGELTPTDRPDIMSSEYDNILYKVTEQGQVIPLKSPIDGGELAVSGKNKFVDQSTGQEFKLDEFGEIVPFLDAV